MRKEQQKMKKRSTRKGKGKALLCTTTSVQIAALSIFTEAFYQL
jgi:hypothetical protein